MNYTHLPKKWEELPLEIQNNILKGALLHAVKQCKETYGISLADAKGIVDKMRFMIQNTGVSATLKNKASVSGMKLCPNCGKEIADDSLFCEYCGAKLTQKTTSSADAHPIPMTFVHAVSICFKKYITFAGRAGRAEYWWFVLFYMLIEVCTTMWDAIIGTGGFFSTIAYIVLLLPGLSVAIRRYHDTNHSGWWILCPIYNIILLFVEGDKQDNDFGAVES